MPTGRLQELVGVVLFRSDCLAALRLAFADDFGQRSDQFVGQVGDFLAEQGSLSFE